MIAIIDYGLGNIRAFANIFKNLGAPFKIASTQTDLQDARKILLPGVGAFDHAMERLEASGMHDTLNELVLERKVPVLGICIGMQILARSSEEGTRTGLSWIDGVVRRLHAEEGAPKVMLPHMGWNNVEPTGDNPLLRGMSEDGAFYFLHSYYFQCDNTGNVIAETDYGGRFACAVNSNNIYGVQFHPEKSHKNGIRLLKNFAEL
jgi:glutamine amidotransferase